MNIVWDRRRRALRQLGSGVAIGAALLVQGCQKPPPPVSTARVYAIDMQGAARVCTPPKDLAPAPGSNTEAKLTLGNDGGWCAVAAAQGGKPFSAGLLKTPPAHGTVYIHTVGDVTRMDYRPEHGFAGTDAFTVQLLPGNATIQASVTVSPG